MQERRNRRHRRRLPPLNPLRAFEAAARHLSFTKAADELSVTQGAVSRSVSALEEYLGFALLDRAPGGLTITPANQRFAHVLTDAFARISDAVDGLFELRTHTLLTVRAYTAFMIHWLIPHLSQFHVLHPEIEVRLISANERVRFEHDQADVRIQYGTGRWSDRKSTLLFSDEILPVCSPRLVSAEPVSQDVLREATLLHCNMRRDDWRDWLAFAGMDDFTPARERHFEEASVMGEAAAAGLGFALAQHAYVQNELRSGRLVAPFDKVLRRAAGYYATRPKTVENAAAETFCNWLETVTASARAVSAGPATG